MSSKDPGRLRQYLELITRNKGGLESALETLKSSGQVVSDDGLESFGSEAKPLSSAQRGLEAMLLNKEVGFEEEAGLEAIIKAEWRPAFEIINGKFETNHPLWRHLTQDANIRKRIESVLPFIGRIELPRRKDIPYGGTGFVVGNGLIMTNRHVASLFAKGLGDRNLDFITGGAAGIDFMHDPSEGQMLEVRRVVLIHPYWDMAILAVDGLPKNEGLFELSLADARDLTGEEIFIVGYPAFDPRNPADEQDGLFSGRYGVKRLQPGELQGGASTASFGKLVPAATHDCSTLGGNSGSAVIDLKTGQVIALHFGGAYHKTNFAVPSAALARDGRVVDAGVKFAATPPGGVDPSSAPWWKRADSEETLASEPSSPAQTSSPAPALPRQPIPSGVVMSSGTISFDIPLPTLRISVSLGEPTAHAVAVASEAVAPAEMREEWIVETPSIDDYAYRRGYDPGFLNQPGQDPALNLPPIPMPQAQDIAAMAKTHDGGTVLRYHNFSIVMHRERRLALVCASNVTGEPALRKPEQGRDYSRKGLGGKDRWIKDPRLVDPLAQLPEVFFTKDRKTFDKGHLIKREYVTHGQTYEFIREANRDTFHVTNCSPQVSGFNKSGDGVDNWGDLENHVMSEAASERLCLFAGPVLDPTDEVFVGVGEDGTVIRAKIPKRYWKIIVARAEAGLAAYGFVLEQDLTNVVWEEFTVPPGFRPTLYPLTDIAAMTGLVFDSTLLEADQYDTVHGAELAVRAGARRR